MEDNIDRYESERDATRGQENYYENQAEEYRETRAARSRYDWPSRDLDCDDIDRDYAYWLLEQDPSDPFNLDEENDGRPCEPWP